MSINLSPEVAAKAKAIPDFEQRLTQFVEHQHQLEQWRARRESPEVRTIVQEGMARGAALKASGGTRDEIFERLMTLYSELPLPAVRDE